jgi:hypothetical protein
MQPPVRKFCSIFATSTLQFKGIRGIELDTQVLEPLRMKLDLSVGAGSIIDPAHNSRAQAA